MHPKTTPVLESFNKLPVARDQRRIVSCIHNFQFLGRWIQDADKKCNKFIFR